MKNYRILSARYDVIDIDNGVVIVEAEIEDEYDYHQYALFVECEGLPELYITDESIFDVQKKSEDELTDEDISTMEDGYVSVGEYEDIFESDDDELFQLIRYLIYICRAEFEESDKFIEETEGKLLSEMVIPMSDIEEEINEEKEI